MDKWDNVGTLFFFSSSSFFLFLQFWKNWKKGKWKIESCHLDLYSPYISICHCFCFIDYQIFSLIGWLFTW